jgi:hypothetical protein
MIFNEFKSNSKVWMYISPDIIDESSKIIIKKEFLTFSSNWKSHGDQVSGQIRFVEDYVLIIGADFNGDSICGRAVDSQVKFVKDLELKTGITLMNRQNICIKEESNSYVVSFSNLKQLVSNGNIDKNTLIYNPMIQSNNEKPIVQISHSPFGGIILS